MRSLIETLQDDGDEKVQEDDLYYQDVGVEVKVGLLRVTTTHGLTIVKVVLIARILDALVKYALTLD